MALEAEGRHAMNPFVLGKLAEIHIQGLVERADENRTARRATSKRRTARPRHHFLWRGDCVTTSLRGAMTK
jgi:hypothetical protein